MSIAAFTSLSQAYSALLEMLDEQLPFELWAITRISGSDWIVLEARDRHYGLAAGHREDWVRTLCHPMVHGKGPFYAPVAARVPAYRDSGVAQQVQVGAYLGVPVRLADGSVFGTICAASPQVRPDESLEPRQFRMLQTVARTVGTLVDAQRRLDGQPVGALPDETVPAEGGAQRDMLTGLASALRWQAVMTTLNRQVTGLGDDVSVLMLDLDGFKELNERHGTEAGDRLLQRTARVLQACARPGDTVARLGGDRFGILLPHLRGAELAVLAARVRQALQAEWIEASVGACASAEAGSLREAAVQADRRLFAEKRARRDGARAAV